MSNRDFINSLSDQELHAVLYAARIAMCDTSICSHIPLSQPDINNLEYKIYNCIKNTVASPKTTEINDLAAALEMIRTLKNDILAYQKENESLSIECADALTQRDEARRMVCEYKADRLNGADDPAPLTPQEIARMENWDCFNFPYTHNA